MDVVVVGACNTDLVSYVDRLPRPGETIHGIRFKTGFGGKGANQCVMAARLGARTAMIGRVGDDTFGADTRRNFQAQNVNIDYLTTTEGMATGVAPIAVEKSGQNSIVIINGANDCVGEADLVHAQPLLTAARVVVCQLEIKLATTLSALRMAREAGVKTIFNPSPAPEHLTPEMYSLCDILCLNETEANMLTGSDVRDPQSAAAACQTLQRSGCPIVVLTLGEQGAVLLEGTETTHVPAPAVHAVDTTGAGDAFLGALAFFVATTKVPLKEVVRRCNEIAAISVQSDGTQSSFPRRDALPASLFA